MCVCVTERERERKRERERERERERYGRQARQCEQLPARATGQALRHGLEHEREKIEK